jgi:hypothetical protein
MHCFRLAPEHPRAEGNVKWYSDEMEKQGLKIVNSELPPIENRRGDNSGVPERDAYEALCRGEVPVVSIILNMQLR